MMAHSIHRGVALPFPNDVHTTSLVQLHPRAPPWRDLLHIKEQGARGQVLHIRMCVPGEPAHAIPLRLQLRTAHDHPGFLQLFSLVVPLLEQTLQEIWLFVHWVFLPRLFEGIYHGPSVVTSMETPS